jgi:hypothetical protein
MVVVMNSTWTTSVNRLTHTRALHLVRSYLALTILIGIASYNGEVTTMFDERLQFNTSLYFWFDIESGQVCSISESSQDFRNGFHENICVVLNFYSSRTVF